MPMTLKADVARAKMRNGAGKPVDLAHLSAQTFGDAALEIEVLQIFLTHAPIYVQAWRNAASTDARNRAAHTLKGAARGIGAWDLADLAAQAELGDLAAEAMDAELERVCGYIRTII